MKIEKRMNNIYDKKTLFILFILCLSFLLPAFLEAAPQMSDYCYLPPFVTDPNTPPNIMIIFDRTIFGKNRAYQSTYDPTKSYYGFFDSNARYKHNGTAFVKDNSCTPSASNSYNCFPGNLLNFALMSTLDLARKAFIGFGWTPVNSGAGDVYSYTGSLTAYGASNASTVDVAQGVCGISFAGSTYSYYFSIGNDGTGSSKASPVTIRVRNDATCPGSKGGTIAVSNKDIAMSYTDENRIGLIQKYGDDNKDLQYDYPAGKARFGMKRWKMGSGNDKATEIIDDGLTITATEKESYLRSILNTTSSSPSEDPGASPLGDMMRDVISYFSNSTAYSVTSSDNNSFTQSPYNWSRDPLSACRKTFAVFVTAGSDLSDSSPLSTTCVNNTAKYCTNNIQQSCTVDADCTSGSSTGQCKVLSTPFAQDACYGYKTDLYTADGGTFSPQSKWQNIRTYVVHTMSGVQCTGSPKKCSNNTSLSCTTDDDCTNESKLKFAAFNAGGEYIPVSDPSTLETKIEEAILNILSTSASASTVATLTTQTRESSTLTQAYFYPKKEGKKLKWIGYLRLLWSDTGANLREDTANTGWLDLKKDKILSFFYDATNVAYRARVYGVTSTSPYLTMNSCEPNTSSTPDAFGNATINNDDVLPIWNAQTKLLSRAPSDRIIKIGIDSSSGSNANNIVRGSESEMYSFTTGLNTTLQPFWSYGSSCQASGYPITNRWCAYDADCNYCTSNTGRTCPGGTNAECNYCNGNLSISCTTSLTCSDGTGGCTGRNAGDVCDDASGVCVSDCYEYYGTCSGGVCTEDGTRTCITNSDCIIDNRGTGFSGSACITSDTCTIAAANTCKTECDASNCATSVIKFIQGYDKPSPSGSNYRLRHDPEQAGSDITSTLKLGDIVYSTPRISPNAAVNGYDVIYKDATYSTFVQSNTIKQATPIVIVGANDGMVHAFKVAKIKDIDPPSETSGQDTTGTPDGSYQTARFTDYPPTSDSAPPTDIGKELWAYIPYNVIPYLRWYCSESYCHIPMVDARFSIIDASINGNATDTRTSSSWRRLLIGAMGVGGKRITLGTKTFSSSIFVLDITDPQNPSLLWERQMPDNTLTTSTPAVVRLHSSASTENGSWYLVMGSGPASIYTSDVKYKKVCSSTTTRLCEKNEECPSGESCTAAVSAANAKIFIFDLKTGSHLATKDLGVAGVAIGDMLSVDMDSDYQTDDIYFGTYGGTGSGQTGKLYRLRIRNNTSYYTNPIDWTISTVVDAGRPIYAAPEIAQDAIGNIWLYFGTGLYLSHEHAYATTDNEYLFGVKEKIECWKGSGSCSTYTNFLDTTNITFTGAKAVQIGCFCAGILRSTINCDTSGNCTGSCGDNKVCSNNPSQTCSSDSQCPSGGTCIENKVVLKVKDATLSGYSGTGTSCNGQVDVAAIACVESRINNDGCSGSACNGWKRAVQGKKNFSKPFVAGGLVDFTIFEPTSTGCSLGGNTHLVSLHYTTGTPYSQPTIFLSGGTSGSTTSLTINPSVNLGIGIPPLGESLVALPLAGDTYKVITQVSGGLSSTALSPSVPATTGYILWLVK